MNVLPENIEVLVRNIANKEGFFDYDVIIGSNTNKNDNFLGELFSVVVSGKQITAHGTKIDAKLNLICKFAPVSSLKKKLKIELLYEREILFYKNVAPAFQRFQEEKKLPKEDQFTSFPKCYDTIYDFENDVCVIIMKDLRPDGFEMWPNEKLVPIERLRLIVQELAKFHAISFAMKDQQPERFANFKKLDDLLRCFSTIVHFVNVFKQTIHRTLKALHSDEHKHMMRELLENYNDIWMNCLTGKFSDQSCVVTHGDCWKNNVIYRSAVSSTYNVEREKRFV